MTHWCCAQSLCDQSLGSREVVVGCSRWPVQRRSLEYSSPLPEWSLVIVVDQQRGHLLHFEMNEDERKNTLICHKLYLRWHAFFFFFWKGIKWSIVYPALLVQCVPCAAWISVSRCLLMMWTCVIALWFHVLLYICVLCAPNLLYSILNTTPCVYIVQCSSTKVLGLEGFFSPVWPLVPKMFVIKAN